MEANKPFIADPWRNLRRSGAHAAWVAALCCAVPIGIGIHRNATGHGDTAHLVWTVGVAVALIAASAVGIKVIRAIDQGTQWLLTGLCWALILIAVGNAHLFTGGGHE